MPDSRRRVTMRYGRHGLALQIPAHAEILEPASPPPPVDDPRAAIEAALEAPISAPPLEQIVRRKLGGKPQARVAITISDITRPVPNRLFLPPIIDRLNRAGISDRQIVIIVGTGLHRRSTAEEHAELVGPEVLARGIEIVDHDAHDASTLATLPANPATGVARVRICRRFAEADLRIVTGFIEPHFMAGFSGGRKGVCPALVDLETVQSFHGYRTLSHERAEAGLLEGNPCHDIALAVARQVGVDFLLNVALTPQKELAAVYAGELEAAHAAGCRDVAGWTQVRVERPYEMVVTSGGGYPLDLTYYQTVKGMVGALPALAARSTLLVVSECAEGIGSPAFTQLVLRYGRDWQGFIKAAADASSAVEHDQWQFQMQARVLRRIGVERLMLASSLDGALVSRLAVTPVAGHPAQAVVARVQSAVEAFAAANPAARIAVIPDGPYTMLR